jgi:threonine synthase
MGLAMDIFCPACGRKVSPGDGAFACPEARPGEDHFLRKKLAPGPDTGDKIRDLWESGDRRSFSVFRELLSSRHLAGESSYVNILHTIEARLEREEGHGFRVTPCTRETGLARALGRSGQVWVKNETGNITGSHKGRHLMGTLLYLEALREAADQRQKQVLAIYSCGNAALGAAAVARAGEYELHAYVPTDVNPAVERMLLERGAIVEKMARLDTAAGDPCYNAFREAVDLKGWAPFSCSGNDNWSNIEGGETLGWEMARQLHSRSARVSSLVIQVGGGALARAAVQGWREMHRMGLAHELPRIHVCQPQGGFPFARAYYCILADIARKNHLQLDWSYDREGSPGSELTKLRAATVTHADQFRAVARYAQKEFQTDRVQGPLSNGLKNRKRFMWAWDGAAPESLAHGILDDETYDWYDLLRAVLITGGKAEILTEETIVKAHKLAHASTDISPCATGTAGLAGLIQLQDSGDIDPTEDVGLFFTGLQR